MHSLRRPEPAIASAAALLLLAIPILAVPVPAAAGPAAGTPASWQREITRGNVLIQRVPAAGPGAAAGVESEPPAAAVLASGWTLRFSGASRVFRDISFADANTGFAAAELGVVVRTSDGGAHWQVVMNLGYPYYWYGVHALSPTDVIVSGFQNQTGEGIIRWTHDGGTTWGAITTAFPTAWLDRVRFADALHGVATTIGGGHVAHTTTGGALATDWDQPTADPSGGWFSGNFTFFPNLSVFITGIRFCRSTDGGATWLDAPSADPVFDGAVDFVDMQTGFTGGGTISPAVAGWIHRTADGGATWSGRLVSTPYPVRTVRFVDRGHGWAAGGNTYSGAGGIYATTDGGTTWVPEFPTGAEMSGLALARVSPDSVDVWCCGYTASFQGRIYQRRVYSPAAASAVAGGGPAAGAVGQAAPNPFRDATTLSFSMTRRGTARIDIVDSTGRLIRRIDAGTRESGTHGVPWDGRDERGRPAPSGAYFWRVETESGATGGRLVLVR